MPASGGDCAKLTIIMRGTIIRVVACAALAPHGSYFDMLAKLDRIKAGDKGDVWIDPRGYESAVAEREHAFEAELSREQSAPL